MNNKMMKKVFAFFMIAALIITNGTLTTFAAQNIKVEGVYTNFQKASLATGETKQITTYTQPEKATNQKMKFTSSNTDVATVSKQGLITAVAPGKATITVTATDGSSQKEQVKVTVLDNLTITKKNVDSDNEVIVMDKTYGHVTIDKSVGSAVVYFSGVTIKGDLIMKNGNYSLHLYDTTAKKILIDEAKTEAGKVASLSQYDSNTSRPTLYLTDHTDIPVIEAKISAIIKQADDALIHSISFIQEYDNKLEIYLEGYTGALDLNTSSTQDFVFVTKECNISQVTVVDTNNAGLLEFIDDGNSVLGTVSVTGPAKVNLNVKTTEIILDQNTKDAKLDIKGNVNSITNFGIGTVLNIDGKVDKVVSTGSNAMITINTGATVDNAQIAGEKSTIAGNGSLTNVTIEANGCSVETVNTTVTVGNNVSGAFVQGAFLVAGTKIKTIAKPVVIPPSTGGGSTGGSTIPAIPTTAIPTVAVVTPTTAPVEPTTSAAITPTTAPATTPTETPVSTPTIAPVASQILATGFEDGSLGGLKGTLGTGLAIVNGGYNNTKALQVTVSSSGWGNPGLDLKNYAGKTVTIIAYMKHSETSGQKLSVTLQLTSGANTTYPQTSLDASGGWTKFVFETTIPADATAANLYFEKSYQQTVSTFLIDNVLIYNGTAVQAQAAYNTIYPAPTIASLKDAFSNYFSVGVAVGDAVKNSATHTALVKEQFNSITAENTMKPDALLNQSASMAASDGMPVINFNKLDNFLSYAKANSLPVRGHTLVWHSQTPTWFFRVGYSNSGAYVTKAVMLQRMESYIKQVLQHCQTSYPNLVYAWDVVNEVVVNNNSGTSISGLRTDSNDWYTVFGDFSYVDSAFQYARTYAASGVKLYYNDYNCYDKPDRILSLLAPIKAAGNIDGIGMQSHLSATYPPVSKIGTTIDKFAAAGYDIQITELDITMASSSEKALQETKYLELFDLLISKANYISNVTFWGLTDDLSWRASGYPLLFNADLTPKTTFDKVMQALTN